MSRAFIRSKYPNAGAQLSAMHGWQVIDYGKGGTGTTVLGRSSKNETMAWANAATRLRRGSNWNKSTKEKS